jgi:hypothetical protein
MWARLPIEELHNFAPVTDKFAAFGVYFMDAIALCPSNPRFGRGIWERGILPTDTQRGIQLRLEPSVQQIRFWVIGSQPVCFSTQDPQGHCITHAQTCPPTNPEVSSTDWAPERLQEITLDTQTSQGLRITSKAPFMVMQMAVCCDR